MLATVAVWAALPATAHATELTFKPVADAYVDASTPTTSYGTGSSLWVDGSPLKQAFMRFQLDGLAGREIQSVRLRLYQKDASPLGGRVFAISDSGWTEAMTWDTRPAIDGPVLGTFGAVSAGTVYEMELPTALVTGDGALSLAIDSTISDGNNWGSRESSSGPPKLIVTAGPGPVRDGLSQVASPTVGSSDPTYYENGHRLAITAGGRLLTVHGRHATGVQLAWRDPDGAWSNSTTGVTSSGLLLSGTKTGDWPASIALARDSAGAEHAWVVWAGSSASSSKPLQMVRLSNLDSPSGPSVGPTLTIEPATALNLRPDIQFEPRPGTTDRGFITWTKKLADDTYEIATVSFTDLDSDTPIFDERASIEVGPTAKRSATLVPTPTGSLLLVKSNSGYLRLFGRDASAPATSWALLGRGAKVAGLAATATRLDSGEVLAAAESVEDSTVIVQRFAASGAPAPVELTLSGYKDPTIATDGTRAWLLMVRLSDGLVVSRTFDAGAGWTSTDRVEIGPEGGGGHAYPNAVRRTDGRLRFVVDGPGASSSQSSVLAFQRLVP